MLQTSIIFLLLNLIMLVSSERHLVNDLFNGLYDKEIYSGYLKTDIEGTELFYVFTPSQSSPENDPIILWLTGGPSCSSIYNLLEENGPVIFIPNKKEPILNEYAWNKKANVFYIDSPGGVGFSKLKDPEFIYNDENQAVSLNIAIQNFFKIFKEYQNHTFFISGFSYAGTYIPHLVTKMFKYMDENPAAIKLNLKGFLIGNPYTYQKTDYEDSIIEFGLSHALISFETYEKYLKECPHWPQIERIYFPYIEKEDYKFDPIINKDDYMPRKNVTRSCNEVRNEIKMQLKGINAYSILNNCPSNNDIEKLRKKFNNINYDECNLHSKENAFKKMIRKKNNIENEYAIDFLPSCGYNKYTPDFLNDNITKEKLGVDLSMTSYMCSDLNYKMGDSIYFYKNDIKELNKNKNFTSWLYSGTEDMIVPTLATLRFLKELNYTIKEKWKKWKVDGQVAGMEQTYDYNLKFITVKNAGHSVVEDNQKVAKALLDKFIEYNRVDKNKNGENSFPVWAIILIAICSLIIIVIIVFVIVFIRIRKNNSDIEIEEKGNLLPE